MSRAIAAAKPSIESVVAADRQPTRQSRKQRHQETDRPSTSIKALAKTTASVNHRIARPPRLILIDVPFSPRLSRYIEHRIGDRRIIRLIRKWLKAGVLEDGVVQPSDRGTGQGAVISPLLANIYLHYGLDLWAERWRR